MDYSVPDQLKEILLRRRNKVLINCENNICDIYKDNVLKRINEYDNLKNCCSIENVMENSINVNINGTILKFINGELDNNIKEKEIENIKSEYESLSKIIKEETDIINDKMKLALSFNENLGNLGYSMDEKMFRIVSTLSIKDIEELNNEIIPKLKNMVGNNVEYKPLYPNFPSQVINMKNITLYLNAIVHYWTGGKYIPYTEVVEEREKTNIEVQYKNISIGKIEDIHELMSNLMSAAEAISEQDIKDLNTYFENYSDFINTVPDIIGNKENLAVTVNLIIKNSKEIPMDKLALRFSTVTDVLRLAAVMSGQSASLEHVKFKSFSNKERRLLMELLNNCGNRLEDFYKNSNLWERLCEKIHPNIYKKKYPDLIDDLLGAYKFKRNVKSFKKEIENYKVILNSYNYYKENPDFVIETISNNEILNKQSLDIDIKIKEFKKKHPIFESKLNDLIHDKKYQEALELVVQRPGYFARHLDEYIEKFEDSEKVLDYFETIVSKVSVKVLLSLKGYFQKRHEKLKIRVFLIKGKTTKLYLKNKVKDELDLKLCEKILYICDRGLMAHFEEKPKLNNVYISEDLKTHLIPLDVRNASSALETYSKGTRFNLSYKEISKTERELIIFDLEDKLSENLTELDKNNEYIKQLETTANSTEIDILKKEKINEELEEAKILNKTLNDKILKCSDEIEENKWLLSKKKGNIVRLFIWWTNTKNNDIIDIDLSVAIYDEDLNKVGHVSYNSLKNDIYNIFHSGDIVNGGDVNGIGAAEFIDFDPDYVYSKGARYISVGVISYRGIMFKNLDNCKFGWMERQSLSSDELFNPHTVKQKLDLNCENTSTIPVIFDCKTREIIWVDMVMTENKSFTRIEDSSKDIKAIMYYYLNPLKENMYNLINLHVKARNGKLVESEKELFEGDIAFVPYLPYKCIEGVQYIRPTDLDIILSEYMS